MKLCLKMVFSVFFGYIKESWWWITTVINDLFDPIRPPTKNLDEIARIEIERKLRHIENIYNYEFDVRKRLPILQSLTNIYARAAVDLDEPEEPMFKMNVLLSPIMVYTNSKVVVESEIISDSGLEIDSGCPTIELLCFIEMKPEKIYRGQIFSNKLVSVKRRNQFHKTHPKVAAKLSHHQNILNHLSLTFEAVLTNTLCQKTSSMH